SRAIGAVDRRGGWQPRCERFPLAAAQARSGSAAAVSAETGSMRRRRLPKGSDPMRDKDRLAILDESPFGLVRRIGAEMERLFQPFEPGRRVALAPAAVDWLPAIEVLQKPEALFVRAELPGLTKEEVKIEVTEGYLTLEG